MTTTTLDPVMATLPGVEIQVRNLTPSDAKELLTLNEVNRNIRKKLVNAYRRDMNHGKWTFTGEPVQVSRTGRLINGQHRMTALAGANVAALPFVVITGLPDESQKMMDQGVARNTRDALLLNHGSITNVNNVAALCRWLAVHPQLDETFNANDLRQKVTIAETLDVYEANRATIDRAVHRTTQLRRYLPGSPTAISYSYFQFARLDISATEEFLVGMAEMEWAYKNDPRKAAMRRLQAINNEYNTSLFTGTLMVSVLSRAWNAWRKGEEMETILALGRKGPVPSVKPV